MSQENSLSHRSHLYPVNVGTGLPNLAHFFQKKPRIQFLYRRNLYLLTSHLSWPRWATLGPGLGAGGCVPADLTLICWLLHSSHVYS